MSEEVNRMNIAALMAQMGDIVKELDAIKTQIRIGGNRVNTLDGKVNNLHQLIHTALVRTKGHGPTEPDNGG